MQKIAKFLNTFVFLLPALVVFACCEYWINLAVAAFNPLQAVRFLQTNCEKPADTIIKPVSKPDSATTTETDSPTPFTHSENYHPMYSIKEEFFASATSDIVLKKDSCYVKNLTHHNAAELQQIMLAPVGFTVEKNSNLPQILIYHTHATESYTPTESMAYNPGYAFRTTDTGQNMVAVGKTMADTLNRLGYNTVQDITLHDYPSYNGSYDLSRATVEKYLEKYPSIKIVLDVHRDAVEREGSIINPVITANGKKYAQIMIISGCDNGYMNMPNYRENLKFATNLQNRLTKDMPGLARPILFDYRNYNQQLSAGSILVEVGTHGSTLQQAKNSRQAFAVSLANMLDNM